MEAILTDRRYTYEEWLELDTGDVRTELVDGYVYAFASPSLFHQTISGELYAQFSQYLRGKTCRAFQAVDVKLEKSTIFVPDLIIVCDSNKLSNRECNGAPDLIIEILSPSTSRYDRITKLKAYRKAGVKEYWIIYPEEQSVEVHILVNDMYIVNRYAEDENVPVSVLTGFEINTKEIFYEQEIET